MHLIDILHIAEVSVPQAASAAGPGCGEWVVTIPPIAEPPSPQRQRGEGNGEFVSKITRGAKAKPPAERFGEGRGRLCVDDSGDNRLSRQRHYHGPGGLNGRVRNGNGCDPASMVAGKSPGRRSGRAGRQFGGSVTRERVAISPLIHRSEPYVITVRSLVAARVMRAASRSGWSSCSAVRTGRLRRSLAVHARPIDLVVFQEPSQLMLLETSSRRGLRA